jgi:multimeric flavodoxin WrbA
MILKIYAKPEFQFFSSALEKQIMISFFASQSRLAEQLVEAGRS